MQAKYLQKGGGGLPLPTLPLEYLYSNRVLARDAQYLWCFFSLLLHYLQIGGAAPPTPPLKITSQVFANGGGGCAKPPRPQPPLTYLQIFKKGTCSAPKQGFRLRPVVQGTRKAGARQHGRCEAMGISRGPAEVGSQRFPRNAGPGTASTPGCVEQGEQGW